MIFLDGLTVVERTETRPGESTDKRKTFESRESLNNYLLQKKQSIEEEQDIAKANLLEIEKSIGELDSILNLEKKENQSDRALK